MLNDELLVDGIQDQHFIDQLSLRLLYALNMKVFLPFL